MIVVFMTLSVGRSDHVQELGWKAVKLEILILSDKINPTETLLTYDNLPKSFHHLTRVKVPRFPAPGSWRGLFMLELILNDKVQLRIAIGAVGGTK